MAASNPVVIVGAARTPMGGLQGELKDVRAPELGATAIRAALGRAHVPEGVSLSDELIAERRWEAER